MDRMKTFGKYLLLVIVFYIVSNLLAYGCIITTYANMKVQVEQTESIELSINKAEATIVNGKITGSITNNSAEEISSKYIKIDLISERGNIILTKYLQIDNLKPRETKEFKLAFEAENISELRASITDNYINNEEKTTLINLADANSDATSGIAVLTAILILAHYFI